MLLSASPLLWSLCLCEAGCEVAGFAGKLEVQTASPRLGHRAYRPDGGSLRIREFAHKESPVRRLFLRPLTSLPLSFCLQPKSQVTFQSQALPPVIQDVLQDSPHCCLCWPRHFCSYS